MITLLAAPVNLNPNKPESVKWVLRADPESMYDFLETTDINQKKILVMYFFLIKNYMI
jgi:hypothetical protein